MARYFLDSSALVKHYHQESGSPTVNELFDQAGSKFFISGLALVEVHSAFARLVRESAITEPDFGDLIRRVQSDVSDGVLAVSAVTTRRLEAAAAILRSQGLASNIRTLDAIQLATAQAVHARSRIAAFVAADQKLLASASACNLTVLDVS